MVYSYDLEIDRFKGLASMCKVYGNFGLYIYDLFRFCNDDFGLLVKVSVLFVNSEITNDVNNCTDD